MVAIRLRRAGSKKRPFFRAWSSPTHARPATASSSEILGNYNPGPSLRW